MQPNICIGLSTCVGLDEEIIVRDRLYHPIRDQCIVMNLDMRDTFGFAEPIFYVLVSCAACVFCVDASVRITCNLLRVNLCGDDIHRVMTTLLRTYRSGLPPSKGQQTDMKPFSLSFISCFLSIDFVQSQASRDETCDICCALSLKVRSCYQHPGANLRLLQLDLDLNCWPSVRP